MLETNTTSNNSSVLGATSGGNHTNELLPPTMQANIGPLGGSSGVVGVGISSSGSGGITNSIIGGNIMGNLTGDRLDASSDSAVSSMGSERVPSLSDSEWGDGGSDSAQDYHQRYG